MLDSGEAAPLVVDRRHTRPLDRSGAFGIWLFCAALLVDLGAAFLFRAHTSIDAIDADEREYWGIAGALKAHGLAAIPARRTLPFPLLLAALRTVADDDYFIVQLLLSGLLAITPLLAYRLVLKYTGDRRAAMLGGLVFLLWPPFVRYGASLYSDSVALELFLVYLLAFPAVASSKTEMPMRWLHFALIGAWVGFCVQMKPLYLLYVPMALCMALLAENSFKRGCLAAALLLAGCGLVTAPWSAYLSLREGHFILVSANDGETLAGGLNPTLMKMDDSGVFVTAGGRSTWVGPGKWLPMDQTGYVTRQELELPYSQTSALISGRAREWIVGHPKEVLYLSVRKLSYMWGVYPFWNGMAQTLLGNVPLLALMSIAGVGLWVRRRAWRSLALFWTLPVFSSLVALVSWGSWRFRMPADAGLILIGLTAWSFLLWKRDRREPSQAVPVSGAAATRQLSL